MSSPLPDRICLWSNHWRTFVGVHMKYDLCHVLCVCVMICYLNHIKLYFLWPIKCVSTSHFSTTTHVHLEKLHFKWRKGRKYSRIFFFCRSCLFINYLCGLCTCKNYEVQNSISILELLCSSIREKQMSGDTYIIQKIFYWFSLVLLLSEKSTCPPWVCG